MKSNIYLTLVFLAGFLTSNAQYVPDSVSIGMGYSNQNYYSFKTGSVTSNALDSWDLAFALNGFSTSIRINSAAGAELFYYGDTSTWNSVDTTAFAWNNLYNSELNWQTGAFDTLANAANAFDVGWGIYNMTTHNIIGNRVFILKSVSGDFLKIKINGLIAGTYGFTTANINGSNEQFHTLTKSNFTNNYFGYYSLTTNSELALEPETNNWDLLFTKYTDFVPTAYTVTGVLLSPETKAIKAYPVDVELYNDTNFAPFSSLKNTIGYNWKAYDFNSMSFVMADSTVYFVKNQDNEVYKLVFTAFGGSGNGNFYFNRDKLDFTTATTSEIEFDFGLALYPNPAHDILNVLLSNSVAQPIQVELITLQGKRVVLQQFTNSDFGVLPININNLPKGMYWVKASNGSSVVSKSFVKQ